MIDAAALLNKLRRIRLPFELLVRSVWEEGPEVEYDRTKAALEQLLTHEVARRKREADAAAKRALEAAQREKAGTASMPPRPRSTPGRVGLLTFYGAPPPKPPDKAPGWS